MGILKEFREFAIKGNMVDMAVGLIIGAAFGALVKSLVSKVMMPPLGYLMGGADFSSFRWQIQEAVIEGGEVVKPAVEMQYGAFFTEVINFIIVAFAVFMVVKAINTARNKFEAPPEPEAPKGPTQEELLADIRDLLKSKA